MEKVSLSCSYFLALSTRFISFTIVGFPPLHLLHWHSQLTLAFCWFELSFDFLLSSSTWSTHFAIILLTYDRTLTYPFFSSLLCVCVCVHKYLERQQQAKVIYYNFASKWINFQWHHCAVSMANTSIGGCVCVCGGCAYVFKRGERGAGAGVGRVWARQHSHNN